MTIPIKNIYYMLCYAWNKFEFKAFADVAFEQNENHINLFAKILLESTNKLLKRGLPKKYIEIEDLIYGVKGKLQISNTIKRNLISKQKSICTYDEYTDNILINSIIKSSMHNLYLCEDVDLVLKNELKNIILKIPDVSYINLNSSHFKLINTEKDRLIGFIISLCEFIHNNTIPDDKSGTMKFYDFVRDEKKMRIIFEEFVRNFYKKEQVVYPSVKREIIKWNFLINDSNSFRLLPNMNTDTTLENPIEKIIIDTKYYKEILINNRGTEKLRSENLYQLFSYLQNQSNQLKLQKRLTGILLYPSLNIEYNLEYLHEDFNIKIKTIDLNQDWKDIHKRLLEIVNVQELPN